MVGKLLMFGLVEATNPKPDLSVSDKSSRCHLVCHSIYLGNVVIIPVDPSGPAYAQHLQAAHRPVVAQQPQHQGEQHRPEAPG